MRAPPAGPVACRSELVNTRLLGATRQLLAAAARTARRFGRIAPNSTASDPGCPSSKYSARYSPNSSSHTAAACAAGCTARKLGHNAACASSIVWSVPAATVYLSAFWRARRASGSKRSPGRLGGARYGIRGHRQREPDGASPDGPALCRRRRRAGRKARASPR